MWPRIWITTTREREQKGEDNKLDLTKKSWNNFDGGDREYKAIFIFCATLLVYFIFSYNGVAGRARDYERWGCWLDLHRHSHKKEKKEETKKENEKKKKEKKETGYVT